MPIELSEAAGPHQLACGTQPMLTVGLLGANSLQVGPTNNFRSLCTTELNKKEEKLLKVSEIFPVVSPLSLAYRTFFQAQDVEPKDFF